MSDKVIASFKTFLKKYLKNVKRELPQSYRARQLEDGGLAAEAVYEFETRFLKKPFDEAMASAHQKAKAEYDKALLKDIGRLNDLRMRTHNTKEYWMKHLYDWMTAPKEKRKPAQMAYTASTQRNICYHIEHLEYELKEARQDILNKIEEEFMFYGSYGACGIRISGEKWKKFKKGLEK